jgi:hypothetical protein
MNSIKDGSQQQLPNLLGQNRSANSIKAES